MSWGDVDKRTSGSSIGGRIVKFEDGISLRMRVLDGEPYTTRVHKVSQVVTKGGKQEEVFRTITATASPDESYILKNTRRYPEMQMHNLRVALFKKGPDGKDTEEYELKVLQGGPQMFKQLRQIFIDNGHLNQFDVVITKKGEKRDTEYTVTAAPFSKKIDVDAATAALEADQAMAWDALFTPITADQQKKIIDEAGMDIAYDPAAKIMADMTWERASVAKMPFGKYKDKTVGELVIIDSNYLVWAADNITTNDEVAAACRVAVLNMASLSSGQQPVKQIEPAKKAAPAPAQAPKSDGDRQATITALNDALESRFGNDTQAMITIVKEHGGGKVKLKDLTDNQLASLSAALNG
jgi:uncharacterized protein (DUF3820 family)